MRRIDFYKVSRGDDLGDPEFWNPRFEDLDIRVGLNEDKLKDLDAVGDRMEAIALDRINNSITPLVVQTQERIASIPNLFSATSVSSVAVGTGAKTFIVEASMRETFAVGGYVLARRIADASVWLSGGLVSYAPTTGELVLDVDAVSGAGTFTDWRFYTAGRKGQKGDKGDRGATYRPGGYNPATTYAKDDMAVDQGSLWINVAAAGSTGIAPPVLPTTSNATWEVVAIRPASAADVLYTWSEGVTKSLQAALDEFRAAVAASFGGVDDALAGKASLIHSHAIADVASLQAALDGKVPISVSALLAAGYKATMQTPYAGSGTINLAVGNGNYQFISCAGALTINAPTEQHCFSQLVFVYNAVGAGTKALANFKKVTGDAFTNTEGHGFILFVTKPYQDANASWTHCHVQALQ